MSGRGPRAGFFVAGLAAGFFVVGFFVAGLDAGFFVAGLAAGFFVVGFFTVGFFVAAGFLAVAVFLVFFAAGFFVGGSSSTMRTGAVRVRVCGGARKWASADWNHFFSAARRRGAETPGAPRAAAPRPRPPRPPAPFSAAGGPGCRRAAVCDRERRANRNGRRWRAGRSAAMAMKV